MDTMHLVDPELVALLDIFPKAPLSDADLEILRGAVVPRPQLVAADVTMERVHAAGRDGAPDVALLLYRPVDSRAPLACIYHIHGGGFVSGSAGGYEPVHRALSAQLGCAIVSVEYRLAPETPFPGPLEDCYAGLDWLFRNAAGIGIDPDHIGVMGESAGGGLAAALSLLARDRGEHRIAFQHLIYPMLDDRTCDSEHPFAGQFIWNADNNRYGWASMLGAQPGGADVSPYAAPARADRLEGLPPAYIATGALDLFAEENLEYARRLMRAGVEVEMHVFPGAFHGFDIAPTARVAVAARRTSAEALARALRGSPARD